MFTVKQLSKLAGVTPRTLYHYDDIGLLKPSQIGENGYRYYGEESLLRLQQILFYRELDMPLDEIKRIMGRHDFDLLPALESHKYELAKRIERLGRLLRTVDDTIAHVKGEKEMSKRQYFQAFSDEQQAEYEKEAAQKYDMNTVKASQKKWQSYTTVDKQRIGEEGNDITEALLQSMPKGPSSPEAQAALERWRQYIGNFWVPNDEQFAGLIDLYNDDPRFKANFDKVDPNLVAFMKEAVEVYMTKRK